MRSSHFLLQVALIVFSILNAGQTLTSSVSELSPYDQSDVSLRDALSALEKAYHINIVYEEALVEGKTLPDMIKISNNLYEDLRKILNGYSLTYEIVGAKTIVITPQQRMHKGKIKGKITNKHGRGIPNAQIIIKGTVLGASANLNGEYAIKNVPPGTYILQTKVIGYRLQTANVRVRANEIINQNFSLTQDVIQMDELVITATRNPLTRRESSVAITTKSLEQIDEIAPRSTADLLRVIPGFYVESSGGEVGGNLFARGLPADGSYYYVALMEDGMPVFDAPALSFVNADIFVRVDENIERMEAVRGGNSALFGSNAPGGVINFISKAGGNRLAVSSKVTMGTSGLARYDFNLNGPLGNNWRFSFGGFYRYDSGVRNPGFPSSKGGQLKGNVTRLFKNGYVKFYGKYLRDSNTFYLQLPFKAGSKLSFVDGFPSNGTMTTIEGNSIKVPTPANDYFTIPLADGQKQIGGSLMADFYINLPDDWSFQNTTRYMNFDHNWNALVPFNLVDARDWVQGYIANTPNAVDYEIVYTNHFNADGSKATFNTANGLLCEGGLWCVSKPMTDISNQLLLKKAIFLGSVEHKLGFGTYQGYYTAVDFWYWQNILTDVRNAPRFVDVRIKDANNNVIREVTENGFRQYGSMYMNAKGFVTVTSAFFGDNIKVNNKLRLDIGGRLERNRIHQDTENRQKYNLGGATDADDAVLWGDGTFRHSDVKYNDWAASLGLNYSVSYNLSIYARGSRGYRMPTLDVFRGADGSFKPEAEQLIQGETGIKLGTATFGVNATGYFLQLKNFPSQDARIIDGQPVWVSDYVGKSQTVGMEIEAIAVPIRGLTMNLILTLQNHQYKKFFAGGENFRGNWVQRIPKSIGEVMISYSFKKFNFRANYHYTGKRYANNANTIILPSFGVANFSATYFIKLNKNQKLTLAINLLNAFNSNGLTEGNPRLDNSGNFAGTYYLARPILPRRLQASLKYNF
ncbi:MAG: TonB-dependent receptor [Calditrichaeota bacterium]|nr:TonB-dependent receptor [Calditrichota bacterium]